ncbi:polysaccharide deacetylase WbmS family protein [Micavibrio aeruginosavorus]|uniref:Polysaccharide deacetylase n=1 Tax=Micavibrio aeruginosavorus (strain ARL-13) TaxID=856793 RepID=G2KLW7_MICAA|nr:hypothetical protein [Micavibrio aeruginosavorus]AEP09346.1 putative uncharacterized protein wbmS [Micavibrio aeruginosavorus ARL-13]
MSDKFATIKSINLNNRQSWEDRLFLTFDIDWASDDVLNYTIDIVEQHDVAATWFVTHDTPVLERLRQNKKFELGIHPNFNFLLNGDFRLGSNFSEVIDRMLEIVPEATSVRSHSMTQNSNILDAFYKRGLTHDCNHFVPEQTDMILIPWLLWNDIIKVPYFWEDDVFCLYSQNTPLQILSFREGVKVFNFHPIHVFLNTENLDRYEGSRDHHRDINKLKSYIFDGHGTQNNLLDLFHLAERGE